MQNLKDLILDFKTLIQGKETRLIVLENAKGSQVAICNYGARITHFVVKDKSGKAVDIALGFNTIKAYLSAKERYHGVTVGPFANRIAGGKFILNNKEYKLETNNGSNCLHGGSTGFHDKVWDVIEESSTAVTFNILTDDNEGGFPGGLNVSVNYSLTNDNELLIEYSADAKYDTVINLTNHVYFNLNGFGTIENHTVKIEAEKFVPINENCIPLGEIKKVENTPFDFRAFKTIGKDISINDNQLIIGKGYDHSFELTKNSQKELTLAATAIGDISGIKLEVLTTEPAMQFYTGNYLGGQDLGKNAAFYDDRTGFCFETQHHPDSPNQPDFVSTLLNKGDKFYSKTIYKIAN